MRMQMYMARACHHQEMQLDCIPYMYMLTEVQFVCCIFVFSNMAKHCLLMVEGTYPRSVMEQ